MIQKTLPINIPMITGYLHHAYPLIAIEDHPDFKEWFFSNYIQLYCQHYDDSFWFNFFGFDLCPGIYEVPSLLSFQKIDNIMVKNNIIDISDFIINCINQGYYICIYLDDFYVKCRQFYYNNIHFIHEHLIYGYDFKKNSFTSMGYYGEGAITSSEISFPDLEKAYRASSDNLSINIYKSDKNATYNFDTQNLIELLEDYLYSRDSSKKFKMYKNSDPEKNIRA